MIWVLLTGLFGGVALVAINGWILERMRCKGLEETIDSLMDRVQSPSLAAYRAANPPEPEPVAAPKFTIRTDPTGLIRDYVPVTE